MITFLLLLQIKHWYIDFVAQTNEMVQGKGIYGNRIGIWHSAQHGLATMFICFLFTNLPFALFIGIIDFVSHYHIDWVKMNYGNRDISTPAFWNHLGLDQMAHQIVYLILALILLL
jgi:hypothetical protein